jgi:pimeloyl-ACP methyl ester carboxylesterase
MTARGGVLPGIAWLARHLVRVLGAPASPKRMQQRLRLWLAADRFADCRAVAAPTLVITGEPRLDRVVPVKGTQEFCRAIHGASHATLEETGHIGLVTRPAAFAAMVSRFVERAG